LQSWCVTTTISVRTAENAKITSMITHSRVSARLVTPAYTVKLVRIIVSYYHKHTSFITINTACRFTYLIYFFCNFVSKTSDGLVSRRFFLRVLKFLIVLAFPLRHIKMAFKALWSGNSWLLTRYIRCINIRFSSRITVSLVANE